MPTSWWFALGGGALIGLAASLLFLTHGRIAGISGVLGAMLPPTASDRAWRIAFLAGLIGAGVISSVIAPSAVGASVRSPYAVVAAGLLVGYGTRMGSGCTSGHGVCGLSRLSTRSLVAVTTFMLTGALTVLIAGAVS